MKFIYDGFSEFIYQSYIGVYLPKVHLRKPGLQALKGGGVAKYDVPVKSERIWVIKNE